MAECDNDRMLCHSMTHTEYDTKIHGTLLWHRIMYPPYHGITLLMLWCKDKSVTPWQKCWHRCVIQAAVQIGYGTKLSDMTCHKMVTTQEGVTVSNVKAQNGYNLYHTKITFHVATVVWHKEVSVVLWHDVLMTKMLWHIIWLWQENVVPQLTTIQLSFSFRFMWGCIFSNFLSG